MKKLVFIVCALLFALGSANATVISYDLNFEFSGAVAPEGSGSWLTVTFDDGGTAGSVTMTLESHLTEASSFFGGIYFNFDPLKDATGVTAVSSLGAFSSGNDAFHAGGSGLYDFKLLFGNGDFAGTDTLSIALTGLDLTADMFDFLNTAKGGSGIYSVATHVQGLGATGDDSGWIGPKPVPESASLLLMGLGLLGLGVVARRSRKA